MSGAGSDSGCVSMTEDILQPCKRVETALLTRTSSDEEHVLHFELFNLNLLMCRIKNFNTVKNIKRTKINEKMDKRIDKM